MKDIFIKALEENNFQLLKTAPKSDLHNHATRGGNIKHLEKMTNSIIQSPTEKFPDLDTMQSWYNINIKPLCKGQQGFLMRLESALRQAKEDGITVLHMSFGIGDALFFDNNLRTYIAAIKEMHKKIAEDIKFIPEVCFGRTTDIAESERCFDQVLSLNYFKSIDLVGDDTQPVENYKKIYRKAKDNGFILKAHVGEFGDADSIKRAVETLGLDQVQHGITAIHSKEVMQWLAKHQVQLNICPTSNVMLSRVPNYKDHPIGKLYSNGVKVTINSDDMLIFNQSVSQDYINLYQAGILSPIELNDIRENGLNL